MWGCSSEDIEWGLGGGAGFSRFFHIVGDAGVACGETEESR